MNSSNDIQANRLWNFRQVIKAVGGVNEAARIMGKKILHHRSSPIQSGIFFDAQGLLSVNQSPMIRHKACAPHSYR